MRKKRIQPMSGPVSLLIVSVAGVLLVSGCRSVVTKHPLSDDPKPIDREKFEGTWLSDDDVFHVRFGADGVARLGGVEWKDEAFDLVRGEMIVTAGDEHNFISFRLEEDGKWMDGYFFLAYDFTRRGDLVLWAPDPEAFEAMLEDKQLEGTVEDSRITITSAPAELLKILNAPDNGKVFQFRVPTVLRKVADWE